MLKLSLAIYFFIIVSFIYTAVSLFYMCETTLAMLLKAGLSTACVASLASLASQATAGAVASIATQAGGCGPLSTIYNDSPEPWAIGFQDGVSPGYTGIIELHDNIFFYLVVIAILVFWMLGSTIYYFNYDKTKITHKYLVHGTLIEVLWTIFPAIVLIAIAIPSFKLLYILDEVTLPTITVKVTGHQWYWSYEYSDYETESGDPIEFDSYMLPESDLEIGQTRLLEVDNPIVLPENTHVRFIVSSSDVLHDFAIPAAGIKIDATPGRLNQSSFFSDREAELFGQCSELCGTYHGFMPIQVEVCPIEDYISWVSTLILGGFVSNKNLVQASGPCFSIKEGRTDFWTSLFTRTHIATRIREYFRENKGNPLLLLFDILLFTLVLSFFLSDIVRIICIISIKLYYYWFFNEWCGAINIWDFLSSINESTNNAANNSSVSANTNINSTNTQIIHSDGTWSEGIRRLAIFGSGGFRLYLIRGGGSPGQRFFIMGTTIAADLGVTILRNTINNPNYVESHWNSWSRMKRGGDSVSFDISRDTETLNKLKNLPSSDIKTDTTQTVANNMGTSPIPKDETLNKLVPDGNGIEELINQFIGQVLNTIQPFLEPVKVDYSMEVLANQINDISIILFILCALIMGLIVGLLSNIIILLYSDKIINYFNNKYIKWYLRFTKKFIALEVIVLGTFILYALYNMCLGLRFIATHPINFT